MWYSNRANEWLFQLFRYLLFFASVNENVRLKMKPNHRLYVNGLSVSLVKIEITGYYFITHITGS